jgi:hypothetical protein
MNIDDIEDLDDLYTDLLLDYGIPRQTIENILEHIKLSIEDSCVVNIPDFQTLLHLPDISNILDAYAQHCLSYYCLHGHLDTINE